MTRRTGIVAALAVVVRTWAGQEPGKQWYAGGIVSGPMATINKQQRMILCLDSMEALEVQLDNRSVSITAKEIIDALEPPVYPKFIPTTNNMEREP